MTRFQPNGPMPVLQLSERPNMTPFKQILGLYGMWNALGPETKLRIKKALGVKLNAEDEFALRKLDKQRAQLQDYMDNGPTASRFSNTLDKAKARGEALMNPDSANQLADAGLQAISTLDKLLEHVPDAQLQSYTNNDETVNSGSSNQTPNNNSTDMQPTYKGTRSPDLSGYNSRTYSRPPVPWEYDFGDTWEYNTQSKKKSQPALPDYIIKQSNGIAALPENKDWSY